MRAIDFDRPQPRADAHRNDEKGCLKLMKAERFEVYWRDRKVGYFDRTHSDVGYYAGIWVPSDSESTSEFEDLLEGLKENDKHWQGIVVFFRKSGSRTQHFGLVHDFGSKIILDDPNEMTIWRLTTGKLVGLLQSQGIVDLASMPEAE